MNIESTRKLAGVVELMLEAGSRINALKPKKYWYPLSMATYGVEEILEALDSLCSFQTSMWEKTQRFEKHFAEYQHVSDTIFVNSGSSADLLAAFILTNPRRPLLRPGDEIILPAVTWPTHIWSAMMAGLKVRIADVDPCSLNISFSDLESKITDATKAISLVHLMGNPCDMDRVMQICQRHGLTLLEDCCEALGAEWNGRKVGTFGLIGTFSFFFSHHITTMEGGAIITNDSACAEDLRLLRAHGWMRHQSPGTFPSGIDPRYTFTNWGFNVRPTELQAGFGLQQLNRVEEFAAARERHAARIFGYIDGCPLLHRPRAQAKARPSWFAIPIMVDERSPFTRDALAQFLENAGIETRPIVAGNILRQPVAQLFDGLSETPCPGADRVHNCGLYVGLCPITADQSVDRLLETLDDFLRPFLSSSRRSVISVQPAVHPVAAMVHGREEVPASTAERARADGDGPALIVHVFDDPVGKPGSDRGRNSISGLSGPSL